MSSIPPQFDKPPEESWATLAEWTCATQQKYCDIHGYSYKLDVSDALDYVGRPYVDQAPSSEMARIRYMVKFRLMQYWMTPELCGETFDWVAWFDGDCLITNYDVPLTKFLGQGKASTGPEDAQLGDLVLPYDFNSLHPTVIMARCTTLMRGLMCELTGIGQRTFGQLEWNDNFALRFAIATPPYRDAVWWHSAQALCAMHPGLYPIPTDVRAMYEWTPESLSLHLSALQVPERIALAKDYCERLSLL